MNEKNNFVALLFLGFVAVLLGYSAFTASGLAKFFLFVGFYFMVFILFAGIYTTFFQNGDSDD